MNWEKVMLEYPKCYPLLMDIHLETKLDGEFLLDEFFIRNKKKLSFFRIYILKEIENEL
jgi:hypothetical protein